MSSRSPLLVFLEGVRGQLLPYQVKWLTDQERLRIANKARQVGWTFTFALEAFMGAAFKGRDQLIVSSGERAAIEVLERSRNWLRVAQAVGVDVKATKDSATEIQFANGRKILSLAQNPNTVRGYPGDIYLDEFAHHSQAKDIYTAILPAITRGYRCSVASTPLGQSGPFHDIWSKPNRYSKHRLTIYDAISQGLAVDVELLRESLDDESFRQEFLCEFIDESTAYFPYDLILACIGSGTGGTGGVYVGIDIGRRRDLTVVYVLQQLGDTFYTQRLEVLKNQPYATQRATIKQIWAEVKATRGAIDASGIGNQLAEELSKELNLEPVNFTNEWKEQAAVKVKRHFEAGTIRIPDNRDLISDIHGIKRTVTSAGNIRFDADRTDAGHSDRFWAMALAIHAAEKPRATVRIY